jgi:uncharacterized low-complexity protein
MENKKSILSGSVIASAILALSSPTANAATLSNFSSLGSGAEVRSELLGNPASAINAFELKCSAKDEKSKEATCGEKKAKDGKAKDGKCGEGKKDAKAKDGKAKDGKCGEGKCGDKKKDAKATDAKSPK